MSFTRTGNEKYPISMSQRNEIAIECVTSMLRSPAVASNAVMAPSIHVSMIVATAFLIADELIKQSKDKS